MKHSAIRKLHLWLSIPLGLIITVICLSGAILIFERDFGTIGQYEIESDGRSPLPLDSLLKAVEHAAPEGSSIAGITTYADPDHAYKFMLTRPAMAALWVDQYTGNVIRPYERAAIFKLASSAHRRLFMPMKTKDVNTNIGKAAIGITTIGFVVIVVSGLILWIPSHRSEWRRKLTIPFRNGTYSFLHGLHCAGGVYVAIVITACGITGLTWSYKWYNKAFYSILGCETAKPVRHDKKAVNYNAWQKAYAEVTKAHPSQEIRVYQNEIDVVCGGTGNRQAVDTYTYDAESGEITKVTAYESQPKSKKIKGWIYSIHTGSWGGRLIKSIYLIFMIIGASLPLTGYYLWIKRMQNRHHHEH